MLKKFYPIFLVIISLTAAPGLVLASNTDGTIDAAYKYVWGENIGWIDFGTT